MHGPTDNTAPSRSIVMRLLVRSWEYRHLRAWVTIRSGCAIFNLALGVVLLASGEELGSFAWLGLIPLAGSALLFRTVYGLAHSTQS